MATKLIAINFCSHKLNLLRLSPQHIDCPNLSLTEMRSKNE